MTNKKEKNKNKGLKYITKKEIELLNMYTISELLTMAGYYDDTQTTTK